MIIQANQQSSITQKVKKFLPFLNLTYGPWVAGGAARLMAGDADLNGSDIDVFFPSIELFTWASSFLYKNTNTSGIENQNFLREYVLYDGEESFNIQLVKKKYYKNIDQILDSFDFTCCMFATDGNKIVTSEAAIFDADKKRLVLNDIPKTSQPLRLAKYSLKGFNPEPGVMMSMLGLHEDQIFNSKEEKSS